MWERNKDADVLKLIRDHAIRLPGAGDDFDPIVQAAGDARLVLIGEASHGTHEFYAMRAQITQQLIEERGFNAVIVEADWPDAYRVNRYVHGSTDDPDADTALLGFQRFPQWMWRNTDVREFVEWLRQHNEALPKAQCRTGFYGMDLYSLYSSMQEVLDYLSRVDPEAAKRARYRYGCFEQFGEDPQAYGYHAGYDLGSDCQKQAIEQLIDLQRRATDLAKRDGLIAEDEYFFAEQNARLVKNAEEYYREMFAGRKETWNLRDTHMVDTIEALMHHLDRTRGRRTKAVVWAHNSHLGDARETDMGDRGEINVGSLCRQRWPEEVFNIGFTTHAGSVAAATDWGGDVERKLVNPSLEGSCERLMHDAEIDRFTLIFRHAKPLADALGTRRLERAIGVIYRPRTERLSHYFNASLSRQFDAVIHVDLTTDVMPLERTAPFELDRAETFPSGI